MKSIIDKYKVICFKDDKDLLFNLNQTYNKLKNHYDILYFSQDRVYSHSLEEIESAEVTRKLVRGSSLVDSFNELYNSSISKFDLRYIEKGKRIDGGYMKLLDIYFSLEINKKQVLMIDNIEQSLHPIAGERFLSHLMHLTTENTSSINKIIFSSYREDLMICADKIIDLSKTQFNVIS